jgi:hypothetical protein
MNTVRKALASIGFGNAQVDQPLTTEPFGAFVVAGFREQRRALAGVSQWSVPGSNR